MKANEIQIGNWLWYQGRVNAFPFKVEQITKRKVGYHAFPGECHMNYIRLCECKPIPLTPEILEKNFESESNFFGLQTYKLNENFNLENRGDCFCLVRKCSDYSFSTFWICDLTHLHQLQQALRLCKIEKEIEL